jgi:hypothetical protein
MTFLHVTENTGSESLCQGSGTPLPLLLYKALPVHQFTAQASVKTAFHLRDSSRWILCLHGHDGLISPKAPLAISYWSR